MFLDIQVVRVRVEDYMDAISCLAVKDNNDEGTEKRLS